MSSTRHNQLTPVGCAIFVSTLGSLGAWPLLLSSPILSFSESAVADLFTCLFCSLYVLSFVPFLVTQNILFSLSLTHLTHAAALGTVPNILRALTDVAREASWLDIQRDLAEDEENCVDLQTLPKVQNAPRSESTNMGGQ